MSPIFSLAWCIPYGPAQTDNENKQNSETADQIYILMKGEFLYIDIQEI